MRLSHQVCTSEHVGNWAFICSCWTPCLALLLASIFSTDTREYNIHNIVVIMWQMKLAWRSLTWSKCGGVPMGLLGIFWTVSTLEAVNFLFFFNFLMNKLQWLQSFFRYCFQRTDSLQEHSSPYPRYFNFITSILFCWSRAMLILAVFRLDEANMHWKTCFRWSISSNWYSHQRTWETEIAVW